MEPQRVQFDFGQGSHEGGDPGGDPSKALGTSWQLLKLINLRLMRPSNLNAEILCTQHESILSFQ